MTGTFSAAIRAVHGAPGQRWLEELPRRLADLAAQWQLTLTAPAFPLSYNYVAPAVRADGATVVLKLGMPSPLLACEIEALRLAEGRGMAQLLAADADQGALLLERLSPGATLATLDDEAATARAAEVMQRIWRPAPASHPFPTVQHWAQGFVRLRQRFSGGSGPLPARLVELAERLFDELLASAGEPVLLHGDLHHFNILSAQREPWLAIDPQGVVGEPAYEVGALLRNPFDPLPPFDDLLRIQARRVDQLSEALGFQRQRIAGWGLAQAVLSAWWHVEDNVGSFEQPLAYAKALAALGAGRPRRATRPPGAA
jgi:streptomycin 6-kinase